MKRKNILFLVFFMFILIVSILMLLILNWSDIVDPMPHPLRNVAETTNFEEIWRNDNIFIGGKTSRASRGFLQLESDSVFSLIVYRNLLGQEWILRKQQLDNANIQWEKNLLDSVRAVQMDDQKIFVVTSKQTTCGLEWRPECESIIITMYETIDGKEMWTNTYDGLLNIELVETDDSAIIIHGSANRGNRRATYIIDKTNGDLLQSTEPQYGLMEIDDRYIDSKSLLNNLNFTPISNVIDQDDIIYFVSNEGKLLALHKNSGNILGSVEFVPNDFFVPSNTVTVLAEGTMLIVYFEDSRQIFSFRFLLDE